MAEVPTPVSMILGQWNKEGYVVICNDNFQYIGDTSISDHMASGLTTLCSWHAYCFIMQRYCCVHCISLDVVYTSAFQLYINLIRTHCADV